MSYSRFISFQHETENVIGKSCNMRGAFVEKDMADTGPTRTLTIGNSSTFNTRRNDAIQNQPYIRFLLFENLLIHMKK